MSKYVLQETVASKRLGKPIYFKAMCRIGPECTDDLAKAHRFDDHIQALSSAAFKFALTYFETLEVES